MKPLENRLIETLQAHGVRSTMARRATFATLQNALEPLTLQQIAIKTKSADRASVYRTLELFEALGIVSIVFIGLKKRFELAAPFKSHHHHIYCERCKKVVSIDSPSLEKLIKSISEQKGFHLHQHTLELSGICENCERRADTQ
ncbi:MAG TPA: Fur family transcriptional regulator [Candidatus Saccharimonadales bacterium]